MTTENFISQVHDFQKELGALIHRYGLSCGAFHGMLREGGKLRNVSLLLENERIKDPNARAINKAAFEAGRVLIINLAHGKVLHENIEYIKPKPGEMPH